MPLLSPPLPGLRHSPPVPLPPPLRPAVTPRVVPVHAPAHPGSHGRQLPPPRHTFRAPHSHHRSVPLRAPPTRPATRPPDAVEVQYARHVALPLPPRRPSTAGQRPLFRELLSTLSTTHTSLASLLRRAPSHVTAPPPPPAARPTPPCTQPLQLRHSITLVWLLRQLATWCLTVDRPPVVPLPPAPLPGPHPAHVVFTPASRAADILPLLAATPPGNAYWLPPTLRSSVRSPSGTPMPCTCARCCLNCTLRTPPARPLTPPCGTLSEATGHRPARTDRPALASGTRARGHRCPHARPRPQPPNSASCQRQVPRPAGGPRQARRHPCTCIPRILACTARSPPARPPTPLCGALEAAADRRLDRPHLPATARGPVPAWRRLRLGRPPLPVRPAPASAPRQRDPLTAGPSACRGAPIGHADALEHTPPSAWPAGRARTPARPPRAPHPHRAASTSAARRYPCARPRPRPPAGCAARPPVSRTQGRAPANST